MFCSDRLKLRPTVDHGGGWAGMMRQFEESMEVAERRNEHNVHWDRGENVRNTFVLAANLIFTAW